MLPLKTHKQFEKDVAKAAKRGKNLEKLWDIISALQGRKILAARHRPHPLRGGWSPYWECHIESDWLLIYLDNGTQLELVRTGTHSDLF